MIWLVNDISEVGIGRLSHGGSRRRVGTDPSRARAMSEEHPPPALELGAPVNVSSRERIGSSSMGVTFNVSDPPFAANCCERTESPHLSRKEPIRTDSKLRE